MNGSAILIVDDDPDIVEAMKILLESKGYGVSAAADYDQAIATIRSAKPDLIILDAMLMLNDKSGLELPLEVRKDPGTAHIPILMITAINSDMVAGDEFSPGTDNENLPIDGFINKPAQTEELYRKIETLLTIKVSKWANRFSAKPR